MTEGEAKAPEPRHLGDGVYASFDGYHIALAVNHHTNHVLSLEPAVLDALNDFARSVNRAYDTQHFSVTDAK